MDDRTFDENSAIEWIATIESESSRVRENDLYPQMDQWLLKSQAKTVLDIGCGQGICSEKLDLNECSYTGIDPSVFLINRAHQIYARANRKFLIGNAYDLPFVDYSFDLAFSVALWHLLGNKAKASAELSRVLKQGGHFMIFMANPDFYQEWIKNYKLISHEGARFEGLMINADGSEIRDVLYLHTYSEIVDHLKNADLEILETVTFRTSLGIWGKKRL